MTAAVLLGVLALFAGRAGPAEAGDPLLVTWGNSNCSGEDHFGEPDPVDSLLVLRGDAGLDTNTGVCPDMGEAIEIPEGSPYLGLTYIWGDFDCSGSMSPIDSLKLLRFDAGLPVVMFENCPPLGSQVAITPVLALESSALAPGATFPVAHTCDGANTSPPLSWENVPMGTQSFFLSFIDVDANEFVHWLVYDLPAGTTELAADAVLPAGADKGMTSFGGTAYGGPCPPAQDGPHEYVFTLYALSTELNLGPGATGEQLAMAIDGFILGIAELSGFYDR